MSKPKAPKASVAELQLQQEQAALARQQRDIIQDVIGQLGEISPDIISRSLGLQEQLGSLQGSFIGRLASLGEGQASPALLRDLRQQEQALEERLRKDLGPGFRSSSPAAEAFARFGESSAIARDVSRRGSLIDISNLIGSTQNVRGANLSNILGVATAPAQLPFGSVQQSFQAALAPLQQQRQLEAQFALQPSPLEALLGAAAGGAAGSATTFGLARAFPLR